MKHRCSTVGLGWLRTQQLTHRREKEKRRQQKAFQNAVQSCFSAKAKCVLEVISGQPDLLALNNAPCAQDYVNFMPTKKRKLETTLNLGMRPFILPKAVYAKTSLPLTITTLEDAIDMQKTTEDSDVHLSSGKWNKRIVEEEVMFAKCTSQRVTRAVSPERKMFDFFEPFEFPDSPEMLLFEHGRNHFSLGTMKADRADVVSKLLELLDQRETLQLQPYLERLERFRVVISHSVNRTLLEVRQNEALAQEAEAAADLVRCQAKRDRTRIRRAALRVNKLEDCYVVLRRIVPEAPDDLLGTKSDAKVRHAMFEFDRCHNCHGPMQLRISENALVCPSCASTSECPDPGGMALSVTYFNLDRKPSLLIHKRNHKLRDYLKQLLAKQKSVVPMSVMVDVTAQIVLMYKMKQAPVYKQTRSALLALGLRNFLDYCTQIHCRITGESPPIITPLQDEAITALFAEIQAPFEKLKERSCSTFFSISYVVLTLCKYLRFLHLLPFISLGNMRTRVETQECLMESIFREKDWKPFPRLTSAELGETRGEAGIEH
jgi:hypothetical protein